MDAPVKCRFYPLTGPRGRRGRLWGVRGPALLVRPAAVVSVEKSDGSIVQVELGAVLSVRRGVAVATLRQQPRWL